MLKNLSKRTVCIIAGSPSADHKGARLMQAIKRENPSTRFIGLGGDRMDAAGLSENYGNINLFWDKPFYPWKNFLRFHIERIYHPLHFLTHWQNRKQLKTLGNSGFFKDLVQKEKPDVILSIGNEFFTERLFDKIGNCYDNADIVKPPSIFYTNIIVNQRYEFKNYWDYILYTCPKEPVNWKYFKFPSTYVGIDGVSRAFRFLYEGSDKFKHLAKNQSVLVDEENYKDLNEELINGERNKFRSANGIGENATVFFIAPGDQIKEVKWAVPLLNKSIKHFLELKSVKGVSTDNFALILSATEDLAPLLKSEAAKLDWPCKVIFTSDDKAKYSAMAGSDMGFVLNGEMVYECAAMQLPTIAASKISWLQTYYTLLYNNFNADINIALEGEAFPELLGQYFPSKIAETFEEYYLNPKKKFSTLENFDRLVPKTLSETSISQINLSQDVKGGEILAENNVYQEHFDSDVLSAKKILEAAEKYSKLVSQNLPYHQVYNSRKELLKELKWD